MTVTPRRNVVCDGCNTRGSFIYFAGPDGSRRVCICCSNEQTCIDVIVDLHQSDNPPADDVFVAKQVSDYPLVDDDVRGLPDFAEEYDSKEWKPFKVSDDDVLEQQELYDFEGIEYEYFDLSDESLPF